MTDTAMAQRAGGPHAVIGRTAELAAISEFVSTDQHGAAGLILEGEAGIGKSLLWRKGLELARASHTVLVSRPAEAETGLAFANLIDLLQDAVDERVLGHLPHPQAQAVRVALLRDDAMAGGVDERTVAVGTLGALKVLASNAPLLLAIDDLNWLDRSSARVLAYALRRLGPEPISVLAALRLPQAEGGLHGIERWAAAEDVVRVRIGPMSLGAIHVLVRDRLDLSLSRPVLSRLTHASGGNPFYALEIARGLKEQSADAVGSGASIAISPDLRRVVADRVGALPPAAREAVRAVYALAHPTEGLINGDLRLAGMSSDGLELAIRKGALQRGPRDVELAHPLIGSSTYALMNEIERGSLHGRLAQLTDDPEERARHLAIAAAEPDAGVAQMLEEAAQRARRRGAPGAAAELTQMALGRTPHGDDVARTSRAFDLAMDELLVGDWNSAYGRWRAIADTVPRGPIRARALWYLGEFHAGKDRQESVRFLTEALAESAGDLVLRARIQTTNAALNLWTGHAAEAAEQVRNGLAAAERAGDPQALMYALAVTATAELYVGGGPRLDLLDRAVSLEPELGELPVESLGSVHRALLLLDMGDDLEAAIQELGRVRGMASERGDEATLPLLDVLLCEAECRRGNYSIAAEHARAAAAEHAQSGPSSRAGLTRCAQALVDAYIGPADEARATLEEALALDESRDSLMHALRERSALGFIELSVGRADACTAWLDPLRLKLTAGGYVEPGLYRFLPDQVEALVQLGQTDTAEEVLAPFESAAVRLDRRWAVATARRCRGLISSARGDQDGAVDLLKESLRLSENLGQPFEVARTALALGTVARRGRRRSVARDALRYAVDLFERLGPGRWAERARRELDRVGLRPSSSKELTETELRIAELVATGRRNPEIARALFMSRKTVEAHLTSTYRKLGIHSRAELAAHATALAARSDSQG